MHDWNTGAFSWSGLESPSRCPVGSRRGPEVGILPVPADWELEEEHRHHAWEEMMDVAGQRVPWDRAREAGCGRTEHPHLMSPLPSFLLAACNFCAYFLLVPLSDVPESVPTLLGRKELLLLVEPKGKNCMGWRRRAGGTEAGETARSSMKLGADGELVLVASCRSSVLTRYYIF